MDAESRILAAVSRVAASNPTELTRLFSPAAKTTQVELKILTWVARADLFIVSVLRRLPWALLAALALFLTVLACGTG